MTETEKLVTQIIEKIRNGIKLMTANTLKTIAEQHRRFFSKSIVYFSFNDFYNIPFDGPNYLISYNGLLASYS